jgi:hypothetical protein
MAYSLDGNTCVKKAVAMRLFDFVVGFCCHGYRCWYYLCIVPLSRVPAHRSSNGWRAMIAVVEL